MTQTIAPTTRTYLLDAAMRDDAIKRITKANRRIGKLGLTPYRYTITDAPALPVYDDELRIARRVTNPDGTKTAYDANGKVVEPDCWRPRFTLTVIGATPALPGGWTVLGIIDLDDAMGVQLRILVDGAEDIDRKAHTGRDWQDCHHCGKLRNRSKMFLLRSADGTIVRVGTTCLAAFLGLDVVISESAVGGLAADLDDLGMGGGWVGSEVYATRTVLALALAIAKETGWISRERATPRNPASGDVLRDLITSRKADVAMRRRAMIDSVDQVGVSTVLNHARNLSGYSEYAHRVREISAHDSVSFRNLAIVGSVVGSYLREETDQRTQEAQHGADSQWIGRVGDKIRTTVTVTSVHPLPDNGWGSSDLVKMVTPEGNVLTWVTGARHPDVDWTGTLTATVKAHKTFHGTKETSVLRCKFV